MKIEQKDARINYMECLTAREGLMSDVKLWNVSCNEFIDEVETFYGTQIDHLQAVNNDLEEDLDIRKTQIEKWLPLCKYLGEKYPGYKPGAHFGEIALDILKSKEC